MSDALCGPSNALQNFQKHTSVDRTLQQDRISARQSPSQGFRSQNHNEGILDSEFATFESNTLAGAPLPDVQHPGHLIAPAPQMSISRSAAEASNWATDFQSLRISGPSQTISNHPGPSAAYMSAAPQQGWHSEFLRQHQQNATIQQNQSFTPRFQSPFAPGYAMHTPQTGTFTSVQETTRNQDSTMEAFDESAFEAAFEQARADMVSQFETSVIETHASDLETGMDDKNLTEEVDAQQTVPETIRIGSDTIPQTNKEDPQTTANDADELARTAGQLLNSVSHDTSQKFRESNFLALMRRIRDREVQVEGDEFRETAQSLHPGGKYYPEGKLRQEDEGKRSWRATSQNDYIHVTSNESSKYDSTAVSDAVHAG
ncbi:protein pex20 [Aspergillus lucknowensis]|uniref:Peroxin 20 n=1 Tax=Aspergillus lucknowensis TaxID=176173 RepID=A0ABR4LFA8_9EURO